MPRLFVTKGEVVEKTRIVKVSVLGAGTVGSQVIRLLREDSKEFAARVGAPVEVTAVLVRDLEAPRQADIPSDLLTTDPAQAMADADLVVELIGGIEPARTFVLAALEDGKSVITGNKALLAACGPELYEAAGRSGADLYYEAAVAGAVPVVYGLRESLAGDRVQRIVGIVNGTTNFILDSMTKTGDSYEDALKDAQQLGFAEADPSADVDGLDAAAKCAILASLAFHTRVSIDDVAIEGITGITSEDIAQAAATGQVIKLLAIAERINGGVSLRVHPTLLPISSPLATVDGPFNAIAIDGEAAGTLMFYGQGAGGVPTASAVLSDVVAAASHKIYGGNAPRESVYANLPILAAGQAQTSFQLRLRVPDQAGVLAQIASIVASHEVSIQTVSQTDSEVPGSAVITLATHQATEAQQQSVISDLRESPCVQEVLSAIRRVVA